MTKYSDIMERLREKMPPEYHDIRTIKGKGRWAYVPWRNIRRFLDDVCADEWQVSYGDVLMLEGQGRASYQQYCVVRCTVTICGISRSELGSALIEELKQNDAGDEYDTARGNPIDRAKADAFRNACECFGVGVYLHRQKERDGQYQAKLFRWIEDARKPAAPQGVPGPQASSPTATPPPAGATKPQRRLEAVSAGGGMGRDRWREG